MTDDRSQPGGLHPVDDADATASQILPPEQAPMDDAAGGPSVNSEDDEMPDTPTEDLSVQGGE